MKKESEKGRQIFEKDQGKQNDDNSYQIKTQQQSNNDDNNNVKYQNFKSNVCKMKTNSLFGEMQKDYQMESNHSKQEDFIDLTDNKDVKDVKWSLSHLPFESIDDNFFNQQPSNNEIHLIKQLNLLLNNGEQNPENNLKQKEQRKIGNMLNLQISDSESSQQENKDKSIKSDKSKEEQEESLPRIQKQPELNQQLFGIKQVVFQFHEKKTTFIYRHFKENERLSVLLQREKTGINYFFPQINMVLKSDMRHILSCKKQIGANFQYILSTHPSQFSDKSLSFCGRIVGNFTNCVFNLIDSEQRSILCTTKFRQENKKSNCPMTYQIFILNEGESYNDLVGSEKNCEKGLDELYTITINKKKISYYKNKKPEYNESLKIYMLNFNGRVKKGSVKNFIIQDSKSGRQVLMFGRTSEQMFYMDISGPLTPLLGFGIVIPHFASKLLQA